LAGGNTATFTGLGLYTTYEVLFGTRAAAFTVDSDGQLTVTVPAAASAGPVTITVRTRGGTAGGVVYTYLDSPSITAVTPDKGPVDGGNLVVITGTAFSYTTGVTFGRPPSPGGSPPTRRSTPCSQRETSARSTSPSSLSAAP
jgi:hypothetical protein